MSGSFEHHRRYLVGIAYRMLGSVAEAEDAVQDAFLRWQGVDSEEVDEPRAYLARVVTRLCLDRLKSAQRRREQYVGTWLPEPIVGEPAPANIAEDISFALLMTLERLSPLERAAFLLHDVFDMDYPEIAAALGRSQAACRQLAARAREHVRSERPRFEPDRDDEVRLADAFAAAVKSGDIAALATLLAEDAVLYSDGGGKRAAALNPIYGRKKIVRFFAGVSRKQPLSATGVPTRVNGLPGFVLHDGDTVETLALEIREGRIVALYSVRNPDKLKHLS
jgi:RNA polymerase sigma-70 factor (ECF subfamily)